LLECKTFRFYGHVLGDDNKYMAEGELAKAMENDPLPKFRQRLIDDGVMTEAQQAEMQEKIEAEVAEAREFGLASELPSVDEIRRDVFEQEIGA
jgi:acetoin:2,6-dichlorophenolindophenol oxidoreductase subunit alpha